MTISNFFYTFKKLDLQIIINNDIINKLFYINFLIE